MSQDTVAISPAAAASGAVISTAGSGGSLMAKNILSRDVTGMESPVDAAPSVDQKLFLVVSVALATVCFFTNVVQVGVFLRPSALKSVKSLLLLSQAVSGIFASFVVAFPIHVISARGGSVVGETGYNPCYLGHSGIILVTVLTSLSTATLLLLHYYLTYNHPRKYTAAGSSLYGWGGLIVCVWAYAFGIAVLPWAGWNSWETHDARCHLSTLWPLSFTAFLTFLVGLHMAATLFMWASSRAAQLKASSRRPTGNSARAGSGTDSEASPMAPISSHFNIEGRVSVCGWAVTVSSIVPLLGHVVVASSCAASSTCLSSPHHYHEDESSLPWASLLLTAAGVSNPLLYVFSDDQVSSTTLFLLSRVCCWWRSNRKQERLLPQHRESVDADTNVYVTNDTAQLVGDNT